ncbi:transglycosylase SLT domain-containing protein [Enterobacter asburiae]|uniref:transglycosylase SLT domain-containing protein n=1 Tax=Enterobacter asburiae TaxID=61645 RepID=UPI001CBD8DBC|nr:transglycosylase SLT domain-containing protein [Enterobacter asburiae]UAN16165.1 transglycosylase SLT domain-containing protein [Enterobacter asburiae]
MIVSQLAYEVTLKADEFLNGKKKVSQEVTNLNRVMERSEKDAEKAERARAAERKKQQQEFEKSAKNAVSAFRNVTAAAAGFLGIGAGLYGIKQLFTSTANEIARASTQAKFFGTDVNKIYGMRRGFKQAGLDSEAFIGASGGARMALANIKDPTIFGGLTGAAQNLLTLGARTGLDINELGDPNKALSEFTRYGKTHSQENLMQVMAAAGFDPSDAAKIKSGELKTLVDSETKKSDLTAQQVKEQEAIVKTLGEFDAELDRLKKDLVVAFAPDVISAMKAFGDWIKNNHGDIEGFFKTAGDTVKKFTEAVGGAENALLILAGTYLGGKAVSGAALRAVSGAVVGGGVAAGVAGNSATGAAARLAARLSPWAAMLYSGDAGEASTKDIMERTGATWQYQLLPEKDRKYYRADDTMLDAVRQVESGGGKKLYSPVGAVGDFQFMKPTDIEQRAQSAKVSHQSQEGLDNLLHGIMMTESGGNPLAYNVKSGAAGAYQFMPATARDMGLRVDSSTDERLDPEKSRAAAQIYLNRMLKKYSGNLDDALMAYNWGQGNVDQWIEQGRGEGFTDKKGNWRPVPKETMEYGGKVKSAMGFDTDGTKYYQQQLALASIPPSSTTNHTNNSQTSSVHVGTVHVNTNPQTVDALADSLKKQTMRAGTVQAFASGVQA